MEEAQKVEMCKLKRNIRHKLCKRTAIFYVKNGKLKSTNCCEIEIQEKRTVQIGDQLKFWIVRVNCFHGKIQKSNNQQHVNKHSSISINIDFVGVESRKKAWELLSTSKKCNTTLRRWGSWELSKKQASFPQKVHTYCPNNNYTLFKYDNWEYNMKVIKKQFAPNNQIIRHHDDKEQSKQTNNERRDPSAPVAKQCGRHTTTAQEDYHDCLRGRVCMGPINPKINVYVLGYAIVSIFSQKTDTRWKFKQLLKNTRSE